MKNRVETALDMFASGFNCAQSVLYSFCDDLGFDKDSALKIATAFGAGIARKGDICGAVTGGIMTLSLKYGRGLNDDMMPAGTTYEKTRALMGKFTEIYGTYFCRELLDGCDLSTEEGQAQFRNNDLKNKTCAKCVKTVVKLVEELAE